MLYTQGAACCYKSILETAPSPAKKKSALRPSTATTYMKFEKKERSLLAIPGEIRMI